MGMGMGMGVKMVEGNRNERDKGYEWGKET